VGVGHLGRRQARHLFQGLVPQCKAAVGPHDIEGTRQDINDLAQRHAADHGRFRGVDVGRETGDAQAALVALQGKQAQDGRQGAAVAPPQQDVARGGAVWHARACQQAPQGLAQRGLGAEAEHGSAGLAPARDAAVRAQQ
jgi:hypothetical protein